MPSQPDTDSPILIMSMPRSGSSMIGGLVHLHGVWAGTYWPGDRRNAKGHFENVPIKNLLKSRTAGCVHAGRVVRPWEGFREDVLAAIRRDGYESGPWMFKGSAMYWRLFDAAFSPRWICVRRDLDAIRASGKDTGFFRNPRSGAVEAHVAAMDTLRDEHGGVDVDSDAVIRGDYSTLEAALSSCGLEMDERVVSEFVDPKLWHYGRAAHG